METAAVGFPKVDGAAEERRDVQWHQGGASPGNDTQPTGRRRALVKRQRRGPKIGRMDGGVEGDRQSPRLAEREHLATLQGASHGDECIERRHVVPGSRRRRPATARRNPIPGPFDPGRATEPRPMWTLAGFTRHGRVFGPGKTCRLAEAAGPDRDRLVEVAKQCRRCPGVPNGRREARKQAQIFVGVERGPTIDGGELRPGVIRETVTPDRALYDLPGRGCRRPGHAQ